MKWNESYVHLAMREILRSKGWKLIAGEYPGGTDHELYPLNIVDPKVACDQSPDPRRHSLSELIPDIVAMRGRNLLIGEAKVRYNEGDRVKLKYLLNERKNDLELALKKLSNERGIDCVNPVESLVYFPTLIFVIGGNVVPSNGFSHLRVLSRTDGKFEGLLELFDTDF